MTASQPTQNSGSGLDRFFAALHASPVRRVRDGKVVAGTCAGVARHFDLDPVVVRVAFVLLAILTGIGITAYLLAWFLLPDDEDGLSVERAVRDHDAGSIVLGVFAALSVLPTGDNGWQHLLFSTIVLGAVGWFLWRRHSSGCGSKGTAGGSAPYTPPAANAQPDTAGPRPGAPAHGSPTRGGLTRFDPVSGRWVSSSDDSAGPVIPEAGDPEFRTYPSDAGRAAMWSAPVSQTSPDATAAGAAASGEAPAARHRPRLPGWASALVLLAAAVVGGGSVALAMAVASAVNLVVVGTAAALAVVSVGLLVAGIRGHAARALVVAAIALLPFATGVAALNLGPGPVGISFQVGTP